MSKLIILRATSGSGKSSFVKKNYPDAVMCSADIFFEKLGKFNPSLLGKAHKACHDTFTDALNKSAPLIIVDNTNIKVRDFMPYVNEAKARGYEVEIIRLECPVEVSSARNVHGVPKEACLRMAKELADSVLPEGLTETVVKTG